MLLGETRSRFRGRGMEFEEVRRYQPGDDIRNIDWRVSARTGDTYTKLFREERERPVHIVADQRSSLFFGSSTQFKSVLAAELSAAIAWAALAGSDRIGGQIISDTQERDVRAKRNKQAALKFMHDLNQANQELSSTSFSTEKVRSMAHTLEETRRITRPGTAIFVISDFHDFDQAAAKQLTSLSKHTDITLIQVIDKIEQQLPLQGRLAISDGESKRTISMDHDLREAYLAKMQQQQDALRKAIVRAHAHFTQIDTSESVRHSLTQMFGK